MATAGEFSRRSHHEVDTSRLRKHGHCQIRRRDSYNWPEHFGRCGWFTTKKPVDWTSCWVSSHSIYRCSQRESLSEQYGDVTLVQWRHIFILDIRFLSISVYVVVLYVVSVMYLYLFSRINYSCMASPFIQLSKNTYFYWVICYYHAVIRNSSCQRTKKLSPWKMAAPGANFGGKRVGSNGLTHQSEIKGAINLGVYTFNKAVQIWKRLTTPPPVSEPKHVDDNTNNVYHNYGD